MAGSSVAPRHAAEASASRAGGSCASARGQRPGECRSRGRRRDPARAWLPEVDRDPGGIGAVTTRRCRQGSGSHVRRFFAHDPGPMRREPSVVDRHPRQGQDQPRRSVVLGSPADRQRSQRSLLDGLARDRGTSTARSTSQATRRSCGRSAHDPGPAGYRSCLARRSGAHCDPDRRDLLGHARAALAPARARSCSGPRMSRTTGFARR